MNVQRTRFAGWNDHPIYQCRTIQDYQVMDRWCWDNDVEIFMVAAGYHGYTFQVRTNHEWFALRWSNACI